MPFAPGGNHFIGPARGHWNAQRLVAVINAPTLRPDGSVLDQSGYDAATGLLFANTAIEFLSDPATSHFARASTRRL
ncbi:MAG: hypothetical protein R3F44_17255 [Candidatus Competibacteraceae bacterium]